jgi:hypothetical protein
LSVLREEIVMRKNLSVLLVGVLIGGLLFLAYPATAATTSERLKRLENIHGIHPR